MPLVLDWKNKYSVKVGHYNKMKMILKKPLSVIGKMKTEKEIDI